MVDSYGVSFAFLFNDLFQLTATRADRLFKAAILGAPKILKNRTLPPAIVKADGYVPLHIVT
jgi:hypothetical protein